MSLGVTRTMPDVWGTMVICLFTLCACMSHSQYWWAHHHPVICGEHNYHAYTRNPRYSTHTKLHCDCTVISTAAPKITLQDAHMWQKQKQHDRRNTTRRACARNKWAAARPPKRTRIEGVDLHRAWRSSAHDITRVEVEPARVGPLLFSTHTQLVEWKRRHGRRVWGRMLRMSLLRF